MSAPVDRKFRLARIWSNEQLRKIDHLFTGNVVNISAGDDCDKEGRKYADYFPNKSGYWTTNYAPGAHRGFQGMPNEILFDLTGPTPKDLENRFDVVLNHTTLEHIYEVTVAFDNLCRASRDVVIVVVPFCQVQHETSGYQDFWRLSPTCLRHMFQRNGLEVIYEAANNDFNAAVYLLFVGARHPDRWRNQLSDWKPVSEAGQWVGAVPREKRHPDRASTFTGNWFRKARKALRVINLF